MDDRFVILRMIPILSLIFCLEAHQAAAFPLRGCLPELLISSDSVILNRELKKELLLLDIRPSAAFEKLRIPGSLNVPIFAIKAKTFLKKYDLVLVDDGYRYAQIEAECRYLRRAGFRLRILDGGLSTWSRKGGTLEGDEFARKALNRLSPLNFFPERNFGNWIVLDVSEHGRPESATLFPGAVSVPYAKSSKDFAARYEELLKKKVAAPCVRILVVDEWGDHYGRVERIIRTTVFPDVFFLEGGIEGYKKFIGGISAAGKRLSTVAGKSCCGGNP